VHGAGCRVQGLGVGVRAVDEEGEVVAADVVALVRRMEPHLR